ncbi:MAG: ABC transporter ATP-binding protein [Actinomycetota bacterium]|nr:ABC transporter ATP-binding protein [Euzebyaceae bacterium]MDQ3453711.1 ABC transporter ATP-binding protein [Actinomycetota bacterium]
MANDTAVAVEELTKRYGGRTVVDAVSLRVDAGAVVALLGPNGAGKTTTVECIAGFRTPDAGTVQVLGADPRADRDEVMARMGVMLQEGGTYQAATPREMLRLYAALYPHPLDIDALLERLGLTEPARRRIRTLSGGQKQRLNLALALVGRPSVLLLDEPTSGMDPQARLDAWDLVRELRDDGLAILLTTHFMDEAERLADVVAVIDGGRLRAVDSPAALVAADARTGSHLLVTSVENVDIAGLAAAVGAAVTPDGDGRWLLEAGPEAIPRVTAWFAERSLTLTGISVNPTSLEDVFLRLTRQGEP